MNCHPHFHRNIYLYHSTVSNAFSAFFRFVNDFSEILILQFPQVLYKIKYDK